MTFDVLWWLSLISLFSSLHDKIPSFLSYDNTKLKRGLFWYLSCRLLFRVIWENVFKCSTTFSNIFLSFLDVISFAQTFTFCLNLLNVMDKSFEESSMLWFRHTITVVLSVYLVTFLILRFYLGIYLLIKNSFHVSVNSPLSDQKSLFTPTLLTL